MLRKEYYAARVHKVGKTFVIISNWTWAPTWVEAFNFARGTGRTVICEEPFQVTVYEGW